MRRSELLTALATLRRAESLLARPHAARWERMATAAAMLGVELAAPVQAGSPLRGELAIEGERAAHAEAYRGVMRAAALAARLGAPAPVSHPTAAAHVVLVDTVDDPTVDPATLDRVPTARGAAAGQVTRTLRRLCYQAAARRADARMFELGAMARHAAGQITAAACARAQRETEADAVAAARHVPAVVRHSPQAWVSGGESNLSPEARDHAAALATDARLTPATQASAAACAAYRAPREVSERDAIRSLRAAAARGSHAAVIALDSIAESLSAWEPESPAAAAARSEARADRASDRRSELDRAAALAATAHPATRGRGRGRGTTAAARRAAGPRGIER